VRVLECLGNSSMRLGVPFIVPRQLGAVGGNLEGHPCLLSSGAPDCPVRHRTVTVDGPGPISFLFWRRRPLQLQASWRTGHCPVRHRTATVACPVRDFLPNRAQTTVAAPGPLAHRTLSGAHRIVRCPPPTVEAATRRPKISRSTIGAGDRWLTR
jgi:hypothetical protein